REALAGLVARLAPARRRGGRAEVDPSPARGPACGARILPCDVRRVVPRRARGAGAARPAHRGLDAGPDRRPRPLHGHAPARLGEAERGLRGRHARRASRERWPLPPSREARAGERRPPRLAPDGGLRSVPQQITARKGVWKVKTRWSTGSPRTAVASSVPSATGPPIES